MPELNKPQSLANARKKIAQLHDATDRGDLVRAHAVASGWIAALRMEGLIDMPAFHELSTELGDAFREVGASLLGDGD